MNDLKYELNIIKRLLILQLLYSGATVRDIVKVTGMSSATLYKFIPKNIAKTKREVLTNHEQE